MYYTYILYSVSSGRYYTGHTDNVVRRLGQHNAGKVKATKAYRPWEIAYTEEFLTRSEAFKREMQIKSYRSGEAFKKILRRVGRVVECGGLENR